MNSEEEEFLEANALLVDKFSLSETIETNDGRFSLNGSAVQWDETVIISNFSFRISSNAYGGIGGTSGSKFWKTCSVALASLILLSPFSLRNKQVIELGCGCSGLPGLASLATGAESVTFTDVDESALVMLRRNLNVNYDSIRTYLVEQNVSLGEAHVFASNWGHEKYEEDSMRSSLKYDIVIGCEIIYDAITVDDLVAGIVNMLSDGGQFVWGQMRSGRGKKVYICRINFNFLIFIFFILFSHFRLLHLPKKCIRLDFNFMTLVINRFPHWNKA